MAIDYAKMQVGDRVHIGVGGGDKWQFFRPAHDAANEYAKTVHPHPQFESGWNHESQEWYLERIR